ncbi:MAG: hypothetical protein B6U87_01580 [Candidatus Aenigmarchaeota archaeon ex4484_52]|nr:MAG: hypothetical protein B6U87_01580 [Candidatus Aenigmarchaeota archaeon ex4484_52]
MLEILTTMNWDLGRLSFRSDLSLIIRTIVHFAIILIICNIFGGLMDLTDLRLLLFLITTLFFANFKPYL